MQLPAYTTTQIDSFGKNNVNGNETYMKFKVNTNFSILDKIDLWMWIVGGVMSGILFALYVVYRCHYKPIRDQLRQDEFVAKMEKSLIAQQTALASKLVIFL